ncbi:MAG: DUF4174 domain-containing protein [Paracoccaceae bacterium]
MRALMLSALILAFPLAVSAQDAADPLARYAWVNRPLVIFADTPNDPRFVRQMELLSNHPGDLEERDVVILTDTDPAADGPLRQRLHPRDFMLVLIGKDGRVALRKPTPRSVRELVRAIDKMPMRIDEINATRGLQD